MHEDITLAYSVFLEELSSDLFSVMGLFGNSDFLDNVRREKISLYKIKKLDITILIFYFVILKICLKLWAYLTLNLSWPTISDWTNVKKLKEVLINT